jgi:hypothetical protein
MGGVMAIEISHGKARSILPRSSDLSPVPAVRPPNHGTNGRFTPGNGAARGRLAKQAIARALGIRSGDENVAVVAKDAMRVMAVVMRDMPSDAPTVVNLVALLARHSAVAAFFNVQADKHGLDSKDGKEALEAAMQHGQRAERLTVTALDVATRLAAAERAKPLDAHRNLVDALGPANGAPYPASDGRSPLDGASASASDPHAASATSRAEGGQS